jgi:hypothetical protein
MHLLLGQVALAQLCSRTHQSKQPASNMYLQAMLGTGPSNSSVSARKQVGLGNGCSHESDEEHSTQHMAKQRLGTARAPTSCKASNSCRSNHHMSFMENSTHQVSAEIFAASRQTTVAKKAANKATDLCSIQLEKELLDRAMSISPRALQVRSEWSWYCCLCA